MKKVTLTFIVSDEVVNEALNELGWESYDNAASILQSESTEYRYDISDVE